MRHGLIALAPVLTVAVLAACHRGSSAAAPAPQPPALPLLPMARLYSDNGGGIQDSVRLVVRDQATLEEVWKQATAGQASPPPLPTVDFTKEMVLVVGAGRKTPEDQIHVDSVAVRRVAGVGGKEEEAMAAIVRTLEGCRRFRADAYPVEIVRVRRFTGPVIFEERQDRATDCK
ncbi:MAG: hypothetical protein IRZ00_19665 [Gemmatimonadetes bacterium]|nr:hypothetical protein [Gemmatimonadota bacterium]